MLESEREEKKEIFSKLDKKVDKIVTYSVWGILGIFVLFSILSYFKLEGKIRWIVSSILLIFSIASFLGIHIKIVKEKLKKGIFKILGVKGERHGV